MTSLKQDGDAIGTSDGAQTDAADAPDASAAQGTDGQAAGDKVTDCQAAASGPVAAEGAPQSSAAPSSGPGATAVQDLTRPSDEQILSHENLIREEQRNRPLLGDREALSTLRNEYTDPSTVFGPKINSLTKTYVHFRRTRQDGNCFYRSFLFGVLEDLLVNRNAAGAAKFLDIVQGWKSKLIETGYQELVFEDAQEAFVEFIKQDPLTVNELCMRLNDERMSNLIIMFIRFVTSAEIQRRSDFFTPFIAGMTETFMATEDFCRRYVECMGEESDHIQLVATADAFQVPIRVVYLDNSGVPPEDPTTEVPCDVHEFAPGEGNIDVSEMPRLTALYRPGHYDILY